MVLVEKAQLYVAILFSLRFLPLKSFACASLYPASTLCTHEFFNQKTFRRQFLFNGTLIFGSYRARYVEKGEGVSFFESKKFAQTLIVKLKLSKDRPRAHSGIVVLI
jgi:hypothetical protein